MQTNPAVEESPESPWNQSGREGKGLWRKGFRAKSWVQNEILSE